MDLSGNSLLRVDRIYFTDGTIQSSAGAGSGAGIPGPPGPPGPPGKDGTGTQTVIFLKNLSLNNKLNQKLFRIEDPSKVPLGKKVYWHES